MLEKFLIVASVIYALKYILVFIGQGRMRRRPVMMWEDYPMVSIVVAARNEEQNISRCLRALLQQDYPVDRMQIVAVNDESEDRTLSIMERYARDYPERITIVSTVPEETHARGKAKAIAQGMDYAVGEIILLTDADCIAPSTWARGVTSHFTPDVDVYGGFTVIQSHDLFSAAQQLDWLHLQTLGSGALGLGFPVGVIGNNFAFRRSAYDDVGGYRAVRFTVTEDFALFQAMVTKGHKGVFPCDYAARMFTLPCESFGVMLRQKQRWARGGTENTIPGYTIFLVSVLMLVAFTVAPFISPVAWASVWGTKFAADLLVMIPTLRRLRCTGQLRFFILFEFYFIAQALVIPVLLMNKTVVWKGRAYR